MTTALSVNINKLALLRNSRPGNFPDLIAHAAHCIAAGAHGITVHPRPDQRHVRASDIQPLAALLTQHPGVEFNIEGNPFAPPQGSYPGLLALVESARPAQCTLVPDADNQLTSDHGFDLQRDGEALRPIIAKLHAIGCRVSLFMDPDPVQIHLAKNIGADRIELYTGPFAHAFDTAPACDWQSMLAQHRAAADAAHACGLGLNAGHDLNLRNLPAYIAALPELQEVSIGHALMADAIEFGLTNAIQAYLRALQPTANGH